MKREDIPKYLQGSVARKNKQYVLYDRYKKEYTHSVRINEDFIGLRPLPSKHLLIIGAPDPSVEPESEYETLVCVADHATILIKGTKKGDLEIRVCSDEYPTRLIIDESERKFIRDK